MPNRNRETLLNIIYKRVLPESVIFGDTWAAYNDIHHLGMRHATVNHKYNFVDPKLFELNGEFVKVHTNSIESIWYACKQNFK